ncbi:MAG: hypothetical protein KUG77_04775 [Nannocystaceae bacterium]|nr:hypothetical protein [Nannocystaceae bacterium]
MTRPSRISPSFLLSCSLALSLVAACGDDSADGASDTTDASGSSDGTDSSSATGGLSMTGDSSATGGSSSTGQSDSMESSTTSGAESDPGTSTGCDAESCDASIVVPLPGAELFPEGIASDAEGNLFVGSVTSSTILTIAPPYQADDVSVFSAGQLTRGAIGLAVDEAHGLLLVCDSSAFEPTASALVAIDLESGERVAGHVLEPVTEEGPVLCNDVALDASGSAFVTDSFGARVLRIAAEDIGSDGTLAELWFADEALAAVGEPAFGANGIAEHEGELYVVNFNLGTLLRIERDPSGDATGITEITLTNADGSILLVGPDGIASSSTGTLLVVENGVFAGGPGNRLLEVALDGDTGVTTVLAEGLDIPTTVVETEDHHWVVQGQLDHLFGVDKTPPAPFELVGLSR